MKSDNDMNLQDSEKTFDLAVKSIMEEAEEAVPSGMWDGIEKKLDASAPRAFRWKVVATWVGSVAAAAAIAIAAVFSFSIGVHDGADDASMLSKNLVDQISVVPASTPESASTPEPAFLSEVPSSKPSSSPKTAFSPKSSLSSNSISSPESTSPESTSPESTSPESTSPKSISSESISSESISSESTSSSEPASSLESSSQSASSSEGSLANTVYPSLFDETEWDTPSRPHRGISLAAWGNALGAASSSENITGTMHGILASAPSGGMGITEKGDISYAIPMDFGLGVKMGLSPRWSIGLGAEYSLLARKFSGIFLRPYELFPGVSIPEPVSYTSISNVQHWLGAKIDASYSVVSSDKVDFYVWAGAGAQWCLSNKYDMKNDSASDVWNNPVKATQFFVGAGLGVDYALTNRVCLYLDPNLRYYFADSAIPRSSRTVGPLSFGAELGLRLTIF